MSRLEAGHNVAATFSLEVSLEQTTYESALVIASQICDLLSIARGRRINWISCAMIDTDGKCTYREHESRITGPYSGFELIDHMPPELTKEFLELCYPECTRPSFRFNLNTIANLYADAKSVGLLETRCLLLLSLLDHFFHMTSDESADVKRNKSTKSRIDLIISTFSVPVEDDEVRRFVALRNNLVHELNFGQDTTSSSSYMWLMHFFDRILLSIMKYSGYYLNAEVISILHAGQKAHKLIPKS